MTSRWEQYKEKNGVTPLDMLNPHALKALEGLAAERYSICSGCPELIKITSQCRKCGCFMLKKTKLDNAKCPIGKW